MMMREKSLRLSAWNVFECSNVFVRLPPFSLMVMTLIWRKEEISKSSYQSPYLLSFKSPIKSHRLQGEKAAEQKKWSLWTKELSPLFDRKTKWSPLNLLSGTHTNGFRWTSASLKCVRNTSSSSSSSSSISFPYSVIDSFL